MRLEPGQDPKIDKINAAVVDARNGSSEGMQTLLTMFHPLLLKTCKKWSVYFQDDDHSMIPFDVLLADAQYWFMEYTLGKYDPDGPATYNKFIKDHISQRIRYIYECQLKYLSRNIFPDPDKNSVREGDNAGDDTFETVIYQYGKMGSDYIAMDDAIIDREIENSRQTLASAILFLVEDRRYFNQREDLIFRECICNGVTHDQMGRRLGISRTRISQILGKVRAKLANQMGNNRGIGRLIQRCQ